MLRKKLHTADIDLLKRRRRFYRDYWTSPYLTKEGRDRRRRFIRLPSFQWKDEKTRRKNRKRRTGFAGRRTKGGKFSQPAYRHGVFEGDGGGDGKAF